MDYIYLSNETTIYPHRRVIEKNGEITHVRPKTFALLLALLAQPRQVVAKDQLLADIWDDVAVDEQVLVQSIREIRQLFGSSEVIKTYPRKGYAWIPEVERQLQETENLKLADQPQATISKHKSQRFYLYLAAILAVLTFGIAISSIMKYLNEPKAVGSKDGTLLVLPIKTRLTGKDQQWFSLGAMDQLINLMASEHVVVMDTVYVLNAMKHANIPRDYRSDQVKRMFDVSGAALVVESEFSGTVEEYRLDYKLHFKNDIKRGVLFGRDPNDLIVQLAETISPYIGGNVSKTTSSHQSEFNSELMARALEYMDKGNNDKARDLLVGLISLEDHNQVARQLLAQVLIQNDEPVRAEQELLVAMADNQASTKESARLYYWLGMAQSRQGHVEKALSNLNRADQLATAQRDWLYRAYIAELRGQILNQLGQLSNAELALTEALNYHGVIQCPIGEAQIQLQIAELIGQQGRQDEANNYIAQAKNLIETHQLEGLKSSLDYQLNKPKLVR